MSSSIRASRSGCAPPSISWPSSSCLRSSLRLRRRRSIARRFAVVMSQAPGLSGIPDRGQRSRATTRASWARSSATPTSRTIRASPAMSRGDSILQTASIVRWVSEGVTHASYPRRAPRPRATRARSSSRPAARGRMRGARKEALPLLRQLRANAFLLGPQLRRELGTEVFRLEHLTNLHLGALEGSALEPFDRLFLRFHLPQPEARDQLLRFGERSVDHGSLSAREPHPRALRAGLQPLAREHH